METDSTGGLTRREMIGAGAASATLAGLAGSATASARSRVAAHRRSATPTLALLTRTPQRNGMTEFVLRGAPLPRAGENPFDPDQFDIPVHFRGPRGGTLRTTAFWHESGSWRVRLLAERAGRWTAQVAGGPAQRFTVRSSALAGVVRRRGDRLVHSDGTPYIALGENLCWSGMNPTATQQIVPTYAGWHDRLGAVGATWSRLWMANWSFALEWDDTPLGDYRARLNRATALDAVLADGAAHGIRAQLVLQHHGQFSTTTDSQWAQNPYNAANGGPQPAAADVWTNATTRALFQRRLRYIVSRWWAHPGLLAWELWNEFTLADGGTTQAAVQWHQQISAYVRALDPLDRPITTSYPFTQAEGQALGSGIGAELHAALPQPAVWDIPQIDIVEPHIYLGNGAPIPLDPTAAFSQTLVGLRGHGKPILLGECDIDTAGPDAALDPTGVHLVDLAWGGLFTTAAGSGMPWWWDVYVDARDLYDRYAGAFAFAAANAALLSGAVPAVGSATAWRPLHLGQVALRLWELQNGSAGAIWVRTGDDRWDDQDLTLISGATITLPAGAGSGVTFWNTDSGAAIGSATATGGVVALPPFSRSLALTYG